MAIVTWPLSSGEARGRVGGLVYNTWRGRSYVKQHTDPKTEFSDPQIAARYAAAQTTLAWHALDDQTRADWAQFASQHAYPDWTGQHKRLSGYNWFLRLGVRAQQVGGSTTPPLLQQIPFLLWPPLTLTYLGETIFEFTWDTGPTPHPDWSATVWATKPHYSTFHPSMKLSKLTSAATYDTPPADLSVPIGGFITFFFRPQHISGHVMPPLIFQIEAT